MIDSTRFHMRDQVRHRVRDIMRTRPGGGEEPSVWPAAALLIAAFAAANILMTAPAP